MRRITPKVELAVDAKDTVGETPVWSVREKALYWIDCEDTPQLQRWHPETGKIQRWPMSERIGGFVLKESGGALVVLASGLFDFDFESGELPIAIHVPKLGEPSFSFARMGTISAAPSSAGEKSIRSASNSAVDHKQTAIKRRRISLPQ